jgi:hypothetical protein
LVKATKCGHTIKDTASVSIYYAPYFNLGNDTTICKGKPLTLDAGSDGTSYKWLDNSTSRFYSVTRTGTYFVDVTNKYNCTAKDYIKVFVKEQGNRF